MQKEHRAWPASSATRYRRPSRDRQARPIRSQAATRPSSPPQQGTPVSDDQNTLKVGPRGPALLEDFHFREKIFHFDHERIPERVVHARGFGAHGTFETLDTLEDMTRADIFQRKGEKTEAFVRFSTVAGNKGSADLARDVRGFAVKLYTQEGNWDIVGNNIPVFFIQDAIKFPDLIHAAKDEPDRGFPQAADRPRQLLGLHLPDPRGDQHGALDHVRPDDPALASASWRASASTPSASSTPPESRPSSSSTGSRSSGCSPSPGTRRSRSTAPIPTSTAATCGRRSRPATSRVWEFGVQIFDEDFADSFPFDVLDADQDHPRGGRARPHRRAADPRPQRRQLLRRDRAGRLRHRQHRARRSTSPTTRSCRAATSPTSTPS